MPTLLDPQGQAREIPDDQVQAALAAGGRRAVKMRDPQGTMRWIPEDMQDAALKAGGSLAAAPPKEQKGFWQSYKETSPAGFVGSAIRHPLDTLSGLPHALKEEGKRVVGQLEEAWDTPNNQPMQAVDRTLYAIPFLGAGMKQADQQAKDGNIRGALGSGLGTMTSLLIPEVARGAKIGGVLPEMRVPEGIKNAPAKIVGGKAMDEVIPGDTVTPRQRYEAAQRQGVQLDLSQATNGKVAGLAKKVSEHSLLGSGKYEALQAANREALNSHATKILDTVAPAISREDFGNAARTRLLQHQADLNNQAGTIFDKLSADAGALQPDTTNVRELARRIIGENEGYFEKHPEMKKGAVGQAWNILQNLAQDEGAPEMRPTGVLDAEGKPVMRAVETRKPDTWSDLHKLRSDLMDQYRSPEMVGDRAAGWLKQMVGAVDNAMADARSGLNPEQLREFRQANDIYREMKEQFDTPQNPLYNIVRTPDGLSVANQLSSIKPSVAAYIRSSAPELVPQLQRQAMERVLTPAGNPTPEWGTLPTRFSRAQKEALAGILSPQQIQSLEDMSRTSRTINADSNPSGTAKVIVPKAEMGALLGAPAEIVTGVATGNPTLVGGGIASAASPLANKALAKFVTSKNVVNRVMRPAPKMDGAWVSKGAANLKASGVSPEMIETLRKSPKGRSAIFEAANTKVKSARMAYILSQIKEHDEE